MSKDNKIRLGLNIMIVVSVLILFICSIITKDISRIRGMWDGILLCEAGHTICEIIYKRKK